MGIRLKLGNGNVKAWEWTMTMYVDQSTRVSAPDISYRPCSSLTLRDGVSVTGVTQSLSGDGVTPMSRAGFSKRGALALSLIHI